MKKYLPLLLIFFLLAFTFVILTFRKSDSIPDLKMRNASLSLGTEWLNTRKAIEGFQEQIRNNPDNIKAKVNLSLAYIQEGRITGDHAYYDRVVLELLDQVLEKDPDNYIALDAKATTLLSQHHFAEAVPLAQHAIQINPHAAEPYGILTDAYVETGDYKNAIRMGDQMASLRPDIRSYSRISYLREIHGDLQGAIHAMKLAVEAGYPGFEQTEWCRVQLGILYEQEGDLAQAESNYLQAIYFRPSFSNAYLGIARIRKAKHEYAEAIRYINYAQNLVRDFSSDRELTELYRISNQPSKAAIQARITVKNLSGLQGNEDNKLHGHYADRELAIAYLDCYEYMQALKHALIEYNRRPQNIDVNQSLAWVYYKLRKPLEAKRHIEFAMRTGSRNPVLLYQAGLIYSMAGDPGKGTAMMSEALKLNPFIQANLRWEEIGVGGKMKYTALDFTVKN